MDMIMIGILFVVSVALVVYSVMPRKQDERDAVKRRLAGGRATDEVAQIREQARASATDHLVKHAGPMLSRLVMPTSAEERTNLRTRLATAGFRQAQAQTFFLGSKTLLAIVGLVIAALASISGGLDLLPLVSAVAFGTGAGLMLPNLWLTLAIGTRKEKIRHGLADVLDLLVVSVESGLALDAALKRVGEEMALVHIDLSDELRISVSETQMGIPRGEALENMARRTDVDELRSLVSMILQAEKFGTSIAKALRNQANTLRTKRHQAAEERAQKTAVKLMLPLVLFIFPAIGIVLGGPAALKMIEALKSNPALSG
ncbi:MAG: type II secretion system F family protein [Planctomycetes bacterium]|nr:type II secretion system F family protein [Planctomycetota bacterium]